MKPLTDTDPMPFGKYKGTRMKDVPMRYCRWLLQQDWISKWASIAAYARARCGSDRGRDTISEAQRVRFFTKDWPAACKAQGWDDDDRNLRLKVLSAALHRPISSISDLNRRDDMDRVYSYLGFATDDVASTIEIDRSDMGSARRRRVVIREHMACLGLYREDVEGFVASLIQDLFRHGERVMPLTLDDLTDLPTINSHNEPAPSQLEQLLMRLAREVQRYRKAAGHSLHDMKTRAGVPCGCAACSRSAAAEASQSDLAGESEAHPVTVAEEEPF